MVKIHHRPVAFPHGQEGVGLDVDLPVVGGDFQVDFEVGKVIVAEGIQCLYGFTIEGVTLDALLLGAAYVTDRTQGARLAQVGKGPIGFGIGG